MNSSWSAFGSFIRPARQSAVACSIRSREEETKFHSTKRSPTGSPPISMMVEAWSARTATVPPRASTTIWPAPNRRPSISTSPMAT